MVVAGSNFLKIIQPNEKMNSEVEPVRPAPFSSIVLFERHSEPLCLGTLIAPSHILTSVFCSTLIFPLNVSNC